MFRGYRLYFAALVGLALLTGANQPAKQTQANKGSEQENSAAAPTTPPTIAPEPSYRPYADRYADSCYNAKNHDSADLCAQWRAAIAAEKAAKEARLATIAAIIGTVLSLATVIGLTITIWQTHGALDEARRGNRLNLMFERRSRREARKAGEDQERALLIAERSADAAATLAESSRDANVRQLRAYINIAETELKHMEVGAKVSVEATISNYGQTPAHNVIVRSAVAVIPRSEFISLHFPDIPNDTKPAQPEILAHGQRIVIGRYSEQEMSDAQWQGLWDGSQIFMFWCEVTYTDVFGVVRETKLKRFANSHPERPGRFPFVATPNGNSAT